MSTRRLWHFLAFALPVLAATIAVLPTVDLAYHLRAGGLFLDTGLIPTVDTFTFTATGAPWQNQQWGAEAILALANRLAGWTGLVVLRAALVGVAFGLLSDACRRRGASVRVAAWLTLAAFVLSIVTLGLRPQLFGIAMFAAVLWLVVGRRSQPRRLWLAVPLVALWANLHGSFFLGPLLLGIACLEDFVERSVSRRETLAVLVAALAATLLNPFGPAVWTYAVGISTNPVITQRIAEWQPTTVRSPEGAGFFASAGLIALAFVVAARRGVPPRPTALLWLLPFLGIGAFAVRGLAWWPFVAAVEVAGLASAIRGTGNAGPRDTPLMRRVNVVLAGMLVIGAVAALPIWRPIDAGLLAPVGVVGTAPSGITAAVRDVARPGDRLYAPQPWGSWFEFAIPDVSVAVDSRIELFPAQVWSDDEAISAGIEGWREVLDRWQVSIVVAVADPGTRSLGTRLARDPGWREIHHDLDGRVFVRVGR